MLMHRLGDRRMAYRLLALALFLLIMVSTTSAITEVILIQSPGCQKCAAAQRVLTGIMAGEKDLKLEKYNYFSDDGHRIIEEHKVKDVPSVIIGQRVIGYKEYEEDNATLERLVREALANQSMNRSTNQSRTANGQELNLQEISLYTLSAVLGAGLVAGFNPCLLGILVFLAASVLSSSGRRRELVMMVVFFSFGIFTVYFLFGLGMQRLLQTEAVANVFRYILTAFLLVIGLAQVLDAMRLKSGKPSLFRTDWALKYFQAGVDRGRLSSYFLIGALFSLVKAPCVGAIYLAILDLLSAKSYLEAATYLLFFNLGVILPILVLGGFIALGMSPEQVDSFRKDHRVGMRLATGLALLALAPLIYWQLI
jgi:cytochrome c biogenesis protein CcdA/glutaredoxin